MLIYRRNNLLMLALASLATACEPAVEVRFAQPFPVGAPDLATFRPRDQGQYRAPGDTASRLVLGATTLLAYHHEATSATARELDSLGLASQPGVGRGRNGQLYWVQQLTPTTFWLRHEWHDTLVALAASPTRHLRRYRGWYYLSTPARTDPSAWEVQRLGVVGHRLCQQFPNPDSLRLRALDPAAVRVRRSAGQVVFTLNPQSGRATRQLDRYAGLWLPTGE